MVLHNCTLNHDLALSNPAKSFLQSTHDTFLCSDNRHQPTAFLYVEPGDGLYALDLEPAFSQLAPRGQSHYDTYLELGAYDILATPARFPRLRLPQHPTELTIGTDRQASRLYSLEGDLPVPQLGNTQCSDLVALHSD